MMTIKHLNVASPVPQGSIFVDLDATLAHYNGWVGAEHIGEPVPYMLALIKQFLEEGRDVRIFTARVYPLNMCVTPTTDLGLLTSDKTDQSGAVNAILAVRAIQKWCLLHRGRVLPVTNIKDYTMVLLLDDRARQVVENTGEIIDHKTHRRVTHG